MADKKVRKSIDDLRGDIQELAESFAEFRNHLSTERALAAAEKQQNGKEVASVTTLPASTLSANETDSISTFGSLDAGQQVYRWSMEQVPIAELLATPEDRHTQMLAAIGHPQRMGILLMLLSKPATALEVVEGLELGTTGAAYHHLNVLQSARIAEQRKRGTFSIVAEQMPVVLTILAALSGRINLEVTAPEVESAGGEPEETGKGGKGKAGKK